METTRRNFIRTAVAGSAGAMIVPTIVPSSIFGSSAPSNRINIAMIGCGRQTVNPNIPQLLASPNAQIVAVCDVDSWRLGNAQKQVNDFYSAQKGLNYKGCKTFSDHRDVLRKKI